MSDPCPPAFMRTAPPMEPGTPTAHSKPANPSWTECLATTGRLAPPPATIRVPSTSTASNPPPNCSTRPAYPPSATSRLEPRPTIATGTGPPAVAVAIARNSWRSAGRTNTAAAPPTR
jgi:hypothetical protein